MHQMWTEYSPTKLSATIDATAKGPISIVIDCAHRKVETANIRAIEISRKLRSIGNTCYSVAA